MKEPVLVICKPDAMRKKIVGNILTKFEQIDLELIGAKVNRPTRALTEQHYENIKNEPFFERQVRFFMGIDYFEKGLLFLVYYGDDAVAQCRSITGVTHPEEAGPTTLRGAYGRINVAGVYENVVHVSSNPEEVEREIKLWFNPEEITKELYPTKLIQLDQQRTWA